MVKLDLPDLDWVAVDTETSGLFPDDHAYVACVALAWPGGSAAFPYDQGVRDKIPTIQMDLFDEEDPNLPLDHWYVLMDWLAERKLVMHNGKYDLTMIRAGLRMDGRTGRDLVDNLAWDTMLASRELDPIEPAGLDKAAERAGLGRKQGLQAIKDWLRRNKFKPNRYDLAPWSIVEPYVTTDAEQTAGLYVRQLKRFDAGEGSHDRMQRRLELLEALYRMEHRGVGYDVERSREAAKVLEERAARIEAGVPFKCDVSSAKAYFYGECGLLPDRRTEKRNEPVLDDEQVRKWVAEGVPWAREYQQVTKIRRAISMWYGGYADKIGGDGRLRCSYKQSEVKTGRMSVERVQLQAVPKLDKALEGVPSVRSLIHAREGCDIWNLDLQQAELRVAAKYSRCTRMLRMLAEGADLHGVTCQQVLGVEPGAPDWKLKRDIAKRLTFGSIFQVGSQTFQETLSKLADIHLPLDQCRAFVGQWRRMYPEFGQAYRKAERMAESKGYVRLLPNTEYEHRSYFAERDWTHTAWNRIVQGSLAEFFGLLMAETEQRWPGYLVLTVHDSLMLEASLDEGDELAAEVAAYAAARATELFNTEMRVDVSRWSEDYRGSEQYETVSGYKTKAKV